MMLNLAGALKESAENICVYMRACVFDRIDGMVMERRNEFSLPTL